MIKSICHTFGATKYICVWSQNSFLGLSLIFTEELALIVEKLC